MTNNNQELGQDRAAQPPLTVDFDFLARETFGDVDLQRDVLSLFIAQSRRVIAALPGKEDLEQTEAAHLLSGSARGIGAWAAAEAARAYEAAEPEARAALLATLAAAFAAADTAIEARLADLHLSSQPLSSAKPLL